MRKGRRSVAVPDPIGKPGFNPVLQHASWLMPPAAGGNEPDPRHTGDGPSHGLVVIAARIHSPRLINFSRSSGLSACSATSKLLELLC